LINKYAVNHESHQFDG